MQLPEVASKSCPSAQSSPVIRRNLSRKPSCERRVTETRSSVIQPVQQPKDYPSFGGSCQSVPLTGACVNNSAWMQPERFATKTVCSGVHIANLISHHEISTRSQRRVAPETRPCCGNALSP